MHAFGIGEAQEEIIARSMTTRPPQDRSLLSAQVVSPCQQFRPGGDAVTDMIDILLALHNYQRVMIAVAAHPDTFAQQPVGDVEPQCLCIKLDHSFHMRSAD